MPGRGLLIAAAVLQLAGAALGLLTAVTLAIGAEGFAKGPAHALAATDALIAAIMIPPSIALLYRKRWGWYVSIGVIGLFCAALVAMPLTAMMSSHAFGVGFGEAIILAVIGAPIFVTFGLLVGGRRAVFARAKTAAEPTLATPRGD